MGSKKERRVTPEVWHKIPLGLSEFVCNVRPTVVKENLTPIALSRRHDDLHPIVYGLSIL
ncbi:hypothetical protein GCM10008938_50310 [Deinococcus roseus]|uniref:Uncharacterized protein n=1 Tax=Deinococcus roseus TaxID=392414 RepID=A0ABQ2DHU3_9DEIO|nr:hypothetical protein GCM10008938_50310 [Deinococcus roseus]